MNIADRDGHLPGGTSTDRVDQTQHTGINRVTELGHGVIATLDGERVLSEVVGADAKEIHLRREDGGSQGLAGTSLR